MIIMSFMFTVKELIQGSLEDIIGECVLNHIRLYIYIHTVAGSLCNFHFLGLNTYRFCECCNEKEVYTVPFVWFNTLIRRVFYLWTLQFTTSHCPFIINSVNVCCEKYGLWQDSARGVISPQPAVHPLSARPCSVRDTTHSQTSEIALFGFPLTHTKCVWLGHAGYLETFTLIYNIVQYIPQSSHRTS